MALKSHYSSEKTVECGCDEVGRGCVAGPVFAAAVILPYDYHNDLINDSKQLNAKRREELRKVIERDAIAWSVQQLSEEVIDKINILRASIQCMNNAVGALSVRPELLLIDGNKFQDVHNIPYHCIVKGDANYLSIAAASILAKTHRDALMERLHEEYPMYDWKNNKGYPSPKQIAAIKEFGLSPYHRKSYHIKQLDPELELF
ncbi:MAG: ribonuclease HII [Bacteroidales bacterium]|nr:ribonuclease HII [Bacteroidales bacterium]